MNGVFEFRDDPSRLVSNRVFGESLNRRIGMTPLIRQANPLDYADWRPLWDAYCKFYDANVREEVTQGTWSKIVASAGSIPAAGQIRCLIAVHEGRLAGFATYLLHPSTWELNPICYLEDLYVDHSVRGQGFGKAIIDHLILEARIHGWPRVYWHTRRDNQVARKLYDRYGRADDFVRYVVRAG